jgi:hypothetical protein
MMRLSVCIFFSSQLVRSKKNLAPEGVRSDGEKETNKKKDKKQNIGQVTKGK